MPVSDEMNRHLSDPDRATPRQPRVDDAGGFGQPGETLPRDRYDELSVEEASDYLAEMERSELEELARYEHTHRNREAMIEAIRQELKRKD